MRALGLVLAAGSIGIAAPTLADDKNTLVVLEPSSAWSVDFGEQKCRLARAFTNGENTHLLFLEQGGPDSSFGFVVMGSSFDRFKRPSRVSTQFGELEPIDDREPFLGTTEGAGASLIYSSMTFSEPPGADSGQAAATPRVGLPRIDETEAAKINSITIRQGNRAVRFATGNLGDPIKVMNECTLNFVESWGLDRADHETMSRRPNWTNVQALARKLQQSYPSAALRKGESGIFRLRVIVEADGSISDCVVNNATITESLETPACKEMKRAEFEPALDKDGEPMRSFYTTRIIYRVSS